MSFLLYCHRIYKQQTIIQSIAKEINKVIFQIQKNDKNKETTRRIPLKLIDCRS